MSLSDIVGAAGLAAYAEAALVLFFATFVAVMVQVSRKQGAFGTGSESALVLEEDQSAEVKRS